MNIDLYDLYLTKLFTLNKYLKKLESLMQQPIDLQNSKHDYFIINKDIIGYYLYSEMYQSVDNYNNNNIYNNSIEDFKLKNNNNITNFDNVDSEMLKTFVEPEKLMIKNVEFFNNFFIVDEELLKILFVDNKNIYINTNINKLMNFLEHKIVYKKAFIGKEGIFIVNSFKNEQDENKIYIYFIKNMPKISLDEFRINKLYIFNELNEFVNEFNNYMKGKTAEKYFAIRNFINKGGIFNIMDNAKRIGLYIHIDRIENYIDEKETNENRNYLEKFLSF